MLAISHGLAMAIGFAAGIYVLPILTSPPAPTLGELDDAMAGAAFHGEFRRELRGSDLLHWGEGTVSIGPRAVSLRGRVAPGPDYRLYLSPVFVEDEAEFEANRLRMIQIGAVRTFENFIVPVPPGVDVARYSTVVVWCETFREFITAASYQAAGKR